MTIELLQTLSLVAYIAAGVFLLLLIAMFFLLEIPKLFGDLTGANAKKAIASIRQQNETGGNNANIPVPANAIGGRVTGKINKTGNPHNKSSASVIAPPAGKTNTSKLYPEPSAGGTGNAAGNTTILAATDGTTVIGGSTTAGGETTVLSQSQFMNYETQASYGEGLSVDVEMGFLGSSEIIE